MNIDDKELKIFSRHLILDEFKQNNFNKLQKQKITIIGIGGIGCPVAQYLVSAGIKNLKIIDSDIVDITNLNRQTLYSFKDIGKKKTIIAKKKLLDVYPNCNIKNINVRLTKNNINKLCSESNLIIDTTDNWKTMILINEYCVKKFIPLISTSVVGFDSQITLFNNLPNKHLCLQCIFPTNKEPDLARCDTVGVIGTAAGIAGIIAAQKAINFFLSKNNNNYMTMVDIKSLKITNLRIKKNNNCKCL